MEKTTLDNDQLLIHMDKDTFAVDANIMTGIIERERFFMLPLFYPPLIPPLSNRNRGELKNNKEFIKGVVTQRGEVFTVIDIRSLFEIPINKNEKPYRIVLIKKQGFNIGIYIAKSKLSFLWKEEIVSLDFKPSEENYIIGLIDPANKRIIALDWQKILEETQKAISNHL